jgi:uroporphyrinogen decarboxylase
MVRTPELATEVTLQPLRRFSFDAAILFSDIMTPLPSMGVEIAFNPGPQIATPIRQENQIIALRVAEPEEMASFVTETILLLRKELDTLKIPLIGFAGAPITLAAYLVQGSGSKDFEVFRAFLRSEPQLAHQLLSKLTELSIGYLKVQIKAGVQAIQLFDSWAGLLDAHTYRQFALPYNQAIFQALADLGIPRIYLAVGASHLYTVIAELPCEVVSVDWRLGLEQVRSILPQTLQGNLDPAVLLSNTEMITKESQRVLRSGLRGAHIFNLGHGILRQTPLDHVLHLMDVVHQFDRHQEVMD